MSSVNEMFSPANIKGNVILLKEPKAFLKVVEIVCSMVAFACIADFKTRIYVGTPPVAVTVSYPSSFTNSGAAIFFVLIEVLCWLYSILALVGYLLVGREMPNSMALVDFALSCGFAGLCFLSSTIVAATIDQLVDNPNAANPVNLIAGVGFGYIVAVLYTANCWFTFKETMLFTGNREQVPSFDDINERDFQSGGPPARSASDVRGPAPTPP